MSDAPLHEDNDTPKASAADIKRCDADTVGRPTAAQIANVPEASKAAS